MDPINRFRNLRNNKDVRTLAGNFAWLSLLQLAGYAFPLITMPYLACVIGVEGFGKIAFASAIMIWIQTVADWGFNFTATRDVAKNRDNIRKVSEIFSQVLWARLLLMLVSFVVLLVLVAVIPQFRSSADIILVTFLLIPGHILFPDWFFQAMEQMKYITILNLIAKLFFTMAVFIVIRSEEDYIYQPLLTSLGFVVSGVVALYYILHKWHIRVLKPRWKTTVLTLRGSADVFLNNLMPNLYNSFSMILLGVFSGSVANGIVDAGTKLITLCMQILGVISRTFFPFLSRKIEYHHRFAQINMAIASLFALSIFLFSPWLINLLFTEKFSEAVIVSRILSVSIIFLAIGNVYGTNYLIIERHERELRNITTWTSLIGLVISVPLAYKFSYIGVAITVSLTRGILAISTYLKSKQIMAKRFTPPHLIICCKTANYRAMAA